MLNLLDSHTKARKQNKGIQKQGDEDSWTYAEDSNSRLDTTAGLGASQFVLHL